MNFQVLSETLNKLTTPQRRKVLMLALTKFANEYVNMSLLKVPTGGISSDNKKSKQDHTDCVYEYARETLSLGILYAEFCNAIRKGDGNRIIRCWKLSSTEEILCY